MARPTPTSQDLQNARLRREIADRQQAEFDQVAAWAEYAIGPSWEPSGRHFLLDKADEDSCRRTGERPVPAATVYTVRHAETGQKRHFMVADGQPVEVSGPQEGFGPMLLEVHPTMTIEVRGQHVHPHRYSLCWAPIETYHPKSAERLAALRESRERRREKRELDRAVAANPLFANQILAEQNEGKEAAR